MFFFVVELSFRARISPQVSLTPCTGVTFRARQVLLLGGTEATDPASLGTRFAGRLLNSVLQKQRHNCRLKARIYHIDTEISNSSPPTLLP